MERLERLESFSGEKLAISLSVGFAPFSVLGLTGVCSESDFVHLSFSRKSDSLYTPVNPNYRVYEVLFFFRVPKIR